MQASFAMIVKEFQEVLALDEGDLRTVHCFGRQLVRFAGHGGAEAEDFAGSGNAQHKPFAMLGADRKLYTAFAEDIDSSRRTALVKKRLAAGDIDDILDAVECQEGVGRKVAKNAVRTKLAFETAALMRCALHMRSYRSPWSKETVTVVTNYRDGLFVVEAIRTTSANVRTESNF